MADVPPSRQHGRMPILDEIYIVQHSHTDLGFTADQPTIWDLHGRFLDQAMDLAEATADGAPGERYCWTVEVACVLLPWLEHASTAQVDRLIRLAHRGQIEVMALHSHQAPLADRVDTEDLLELVDQLRRRLGITVVSAINSDVNGQNWPVVDALIDAGVTGYSMAINKHTGQVPLDRPTLFRWQGPSGRTLPTLNGYVYGSADRFGIGSSDDSFAVKWLPRLERALSERSWPVPWLLLQSVHPFGDNAGPHRPTLEFIRAWNAKRAATGTGPRLVMATPAEFWRRVHTRLDALPIHRGDWTDAWNYGAASRANELAMARRARARLVAADALSAAAGVIAPAGDGQRSHRRHRAIGREALHRWHEHTWTADSAIGDPGHEDVLAQTTHKTALAAEARSGGQLVLRDALADLGRSVVRTGAPGLLVVNPLPFPRVISGQLPSGSILPRGIASDPLAGRHWQERRQDAAIHLFPTEPPDPWKQNKLRWLRPTEVPAFGWTVLDLDAAQVDPFTGATDGREAEVVTTQHRLRFDLQRGGVASWIPTVLGRELIDPQHGLTMGGWLHERVSSGHPNPRHAYFTMDWTADALDTPDCWHRDWPAQRAAGGRVLSHRVRRHAMGVHVVQEIEVVGAASTLVLTVHLPDWADWIEVEARWTQPLDTWPQSAYLAFPLHLPRAVARVDVGHQAMRPGVDQLPDAYAAFFTAQHWVDLAGADGGVCVALPENPLVQFNGPRWGRPTGHDAGDGLLLGWPVNNYWETNFNAWQPGPVVARYRLRPYAGAFVEADAHRFGADAAHRLPLVQHLGEAPFAEGKPLPPTGSILALPGGPVTAVHLRPDGDAWLLRLLNASDQPANGTIASGILRLRRVIRRDGSVIEADTAGAVTIALQPRELATLRVVVER